MFQKDYIMRMIEQFTLVLAKIMGLKASQQHEEIHHILNEALHDFTGLSEAAIEKLGYKDLIRLVGGMGEINTEKCLILAELLKQKADVFSGSEDPDKAYDLYLKSLNIYLETLLSSKGSFLHRNLNVDAINELLDYLKPFTLPHETLILLFHYYESTQEYGKAEDILLQLLDQNHSNDIGVVYNEGIAFYERLQEKSPEELAQGNLPLDEVLEGMEKIRALKSIL
jgi:hypothetical protein